MSLLSRIPPVPLIVVAMGSVQLGAALAKGLFAAFGAEGTVFLRSLFAAIVLALVWRHGLRRLARADFPLIVLFGAVLGFMNLAFYLSLERLPLGVAVTIEFVGPLGVALWGSRRPLDFVWIALAAGGIALLDPVHGGLDPLGCVYAGIAAFLWALYIVLGQRLGARVPGVAGLAGAMLVSTLVVAPFGLVDAWPVWQSPALLLAAIGVALLSSAVPYALEIEALRRLPRQLFGLLMSLEPALAALAGWAVLGEQLAGLQWVAIAAVVAASVGATRFGFRAEA